LGTKANKDLGTKANKDLETKANKDLSTKDNKDLETKANKPTRTWEPRPTRTWVPRPRPSSIKAKNSICQGQWQKKKTKTNSDHKNYMHSRHLANTNDCKRLYDIGLIFLKKDNCY